MSGVARWFAASLVVALGAATVGACVSVGEGSGEVKSDHLFARECWDDFYDLKPDFFAADPFRDQMSMRVQRGSDLIEVSDGLSIVIEDVPAVRAALGSAVSVSLPRGVAPPGVSEGTLCAGAAGGCDSPVHIALYLLESCHTQNMVLYATAGTITFNELFSGDPNETEASAKLTDATFDITVGDPRDFDPATGVIANQSQITGRFTFFFQRGQPAQPFP
jgi:hypothetical protein